MAGSASLFVIAGSDAIAQPAEPTIIPLINLWDLTGSYEAEANGIPFTFDLEQDAKGKITGGSNWQYTDEAGNIINAKLDIKGHIKSQSGGTRAVKLSFMHRGTIKGEAGTEPFRAKQRFLAYIDPDLLTVSGRLKTSVKSGGSSTENTEVLYDLPMNELMDGAADLEIDVSEGPKGYTGTATFTTAVGEVVNLRSKGKGKNGEEAGELVRLQLKGHRRDASSGANFKVDLSAEDMATVLFLKGRIMGQKVDETSLEPSEPVEPPPAP